MTDTQNNTVANLEAAGFQQPDDGASMPKTIYVGNLDPTVSEEFIATLFGQLGTVTKCKVMIDGNSEPYAFVEYDTHNNAQTAINVMNRRVLLNKEMRVNWATAPSMPMGGGAGGANGAAAGAVMGGMAGGMQPAGPRVDTSKHYHIFVGDLSPDVDNQMLLEAFKPFGEVSEAKVIRDPATLKSKGYGFVAYPSKDDAERAIDQMNGAWLGRRAIRTNWATRKGALAQERRNNLSHDEVFNQTGPTNTSVYCGNIGSMREDQIREQFAKYGDIHEVKVFAGQGFAFIRFETKDQACASIVALNGQEVMGNTLRCSWGRAADRNMGGGGGTSGAYGYGYGYGGPQGGAGGPPGGQGGYGNAQAAATAQQYWQQYYQYYGNPAVMQQWQNYWAQTQGQQ